MLELVIGNRLRDVSREVLSRIEVSDKLELENFIIVPDRFSLLAEKMIFEELGIVSTFNIQVVGISKLAKIVLSNKDENLKILDSDECKLIVFNILKSCDLVSFKEVNFALADEIYKIIAQLKSSNIDSQTFYESIKDKNDAKLFDISQIYIKYEAKIAGKVDQNDLLNKLAQAIDDKLKYNYFFIEFDSLTEQGGLILEKLIQNANRVVVGATRPNKQKNSYLYDTDILYKVNKICRNNQISPKKSYIDNKTNTKQEHILKNLYGFSPEKIENEDIFIGEFATPEEEIRSLAKIICFEVKYNKKRYRDFNILTSSIEENKEIFEKILKEYQIPFFIDSGVYAKDLSPIKFIFGIFDFLTSGDKDKFLSLIKSEYSQIDFDQTCGVENYLNKIGNFNLNDFKNYEDEKVRNFVVNLEKSEENFNKSSNCNDFIALIKKIIEIFEIKSSTQKLILEFQNKKELKLEKIYQQIDSVVDEVLSLLEDQVEVQIIFNEFVDIFNEILSNKEIYSVPTSVDCVFIGDASKSFFEEREILFIVGATQRLLPKIIKDYSILSDNDIANLAKNIEITPTIKLINKRNKFKFYQNLTLAKEKIIVSYSSTALGEKVEPSSFIDELKKIFVKDNQKICTSSSFFDEIAKNKMENSCLDIQNNRDFEQELINLILHENLNIEKLREITDDFKISFIDEDLQNILKASSNNLLVKDIIKNYIGQKNVEKLEKPNLVYFTNKKISASQIERFYECPFKHFFTYGLKLRENEVCRFEGKDIGDYFHIISENFAKRNAEKLGRMTEAEIEIELNRTLEIVYEKEKFKRLAECLDNKHMVAKLKKEAKMLLNQINYEQKWSDFVLKDVEKRFSYELQNGFKLTGVVDRVDTSDDCFRVIDYKSGEVNQSLAGVYYGIELQLFIYLLVMKKELGLKPVAGLYFPVGSDFANSKSLKKLMLSGFILANHSVLKKLDRRLNNQKLDSDIVYLKLSTKSENDNLMIDGRRRKNIFSEEGFNNVLDYTKLLIQKAIEDISTGNMPATPLKAKGKLPCTYCSFYSICSFKGENNGGVPRVEEREFSEEDFKNILKGKE
jgi:ATP-dependent helicase/nuclease subunit B